MYLSDVGTCVRQVTPNLFIQVQLYIDLLTDKRNYQSTKGHVIAFYKVQETAEDGMAGLQSKFQTETHKLTKVNHNADRQTDRQTDGRTDGQMDIINP